MTDGDIRKLRRKYWRRRAMYNVPEPARILRDLIDVFNLFVGLEDPSRPGVTFLNASARSDFMKELAYVQKGLLSDKPGMLMYVKTGVIKATGFVLHRCRRSSSQLEGYHLHLRQSRRVGQIGSGPRLRHVTGNLFNFRWTYNAAVKAELLPDCGSVEGLKYQDMLYDVASSLGMPGVAALPELHAWTRTRRRAARLQHGVISLGEHNAVLQPSDPREKQEEWLRKRTGLVVSAPSALRDPGEVRDVIEHFAAARAGDAAGIAAATGVRAKPKRLIDLSTQVLESERAHELLDARGYGSVRANVRTAAPAQAACATFNPLPIVTEEGGAAFTTLPVPPELAGAGVGDFAMEDIVAPAQMEEKEDDSAAAAMVPARRDDGGESDGAAPHRRAPKGSDAAVANAAKRKAEATERRRAEKAAKKTAAAAKAAAKRGARAALKRADDSQESSEDACDSDDMSEDT